MSMNGYGRLVPRTQTAVPRDAQHYYCQRKARKQLPNGAVPTVDQIADPDNLIATFEQLRAEKGPAAGPDHVTYRDLGASEVAACMRELARQIHDGAFRPGPKRLVNVPKGSGRGTRTLTLRNLTFRVLAAALKQALAPHLGRLFLPNSYGFRPGVGTWDLLARLEADMVAQRKYVLVTDDIRAAFDNLDVEKVMADHRRHVTDRRLLDLIEVVLHGGEDHRPIGVDQGSAYSPLALNLHLHHARYTPMAPKYPSWYRCADDLAYLAHHVPEGLQILDTTHSLPAAIGFALQAGTDPVDLRHRKAQHLGYTLSAKEDRLKISLGEKAWTSLGRALLKAHETPNPTETANKVALGWIGASGLALENARTDTVTKILMGAARYGFRELDPEELYDRTAASWERWGSMRRGVSPSAVDDGGTPQDEVVAAAPRATEVPAG